MALDYRKCAEEIFSHLGGKENIISAAHCATRLRLVIADNSKIDKKALEEVEGVKGMFETSMVAILVASLCALMRSHGGFEWLLAFIRRVFRGSRGGQIGIALLVSLMNVATANNTSFFAFAAASGTGYGSFVECIFFYFYASSYLI